MRFYPTQNNVEKLDKKSPAYAIRQFNLARSNFFTALILTVVNIVLLALGANVYLLFSVSFPYIMFDTTNIVHSIPALVVLALYIVFYICSKKKPGFMIAALVAFILDFIFLIGISYFITVISENQVTFADYIIDYLTHIWVLVYLIIGTVNTKRYKAAIKENPSLVEGSPFKNADIPEDPSPVENPYSDNMYFAESTDTNVYPTDDNSSDSLQ